VFWPNAYGDIHGYAFWPRAYGPAFWGFAFDDVFAGIFWPPGPPNIAASETADRGGTVGRSSTVGRGGTVGRISDREREATALSPEFARVCSDRAAQLTGRSLERFAQAIQPTAAQQAALDDLRSASAKAIEILQAACPTETPPTTIERFDAMANRLAAMLDAVGIVRPALNRFYSSLNDEQKAQFNRISAQVHASQRGDARSLNVAERAVSSQQCGNEWVPGFRERTFKRIARVVRPTNTQRTALDELRTASARAAKMLDVRCFRDEPLTPTGRLDAIGQRLAAMLRAVKLMAPAVARFYALLSDEQKTRLNTMRDLPP
jgi:hypothetical protein